MKTGPGSKGRRPPRHGRGGIKLAYCDIPGNVYEHPEAVPAFRSGRRFTRVNPKELIPLPHGSLLYTLPGRLPVFFDDRTGHFAHFDEGPDGTPALAAAAFLSSAYLRTALPAFIKKEDAPVLPLWAYAGVVLRNGAFMVPAIRVDDDPRSDPALHENERLFAQKSRETTALFPENRLVAQLAKCSSEYRCLCARNFFLGRFEAPLPTSPACNARCLGCLSHQDAGDTGFCGSQERLADPPSPDEIAETILHHFGRVERAVASFGQGCEGEPLLRAADLAQAIQKVRAHDSRGTIALNTNGSLPGAAARLIDAGLDAIRVSMNSPTPEYYVRYYRPVNYTFGDVERTLEAALGAGIFVSINLFFLPGFTDMETEVESLCAFLDRFPVNMIQARNLNMDPDYYLDSIGFVESPAMGVRAMLALLREKYPRIRIGYYNPPKESWQG
ncbi:MAG: radical SAM protein [Spirochaetes bacterium]|nr:MAG: radical SAM protein [Spirochaetota bacterium]